jgi:hypothetical protein
MELEEVIDRRGRLDKEEKLLLYNEIDRLVEIPDTDIDQETCERAVRVYNALNSHIKVEGENMTIPVQACSYRTKLESKYRKFTDFSDNIDP